MNDIRRNDDGVETSRISLAEVVDQICRDEVATWTSVKNLDAKNALAERVIARLQELQAEGYEVDGIDMTKKPFQLRPFIGKAILDLRRDMSVEKERAAEADNPLKTIEGYKAAILAALPEGEAVSPRVERAFGKLDAEEEKVAEWLQSARVAAIQESVKRLTSERIETGFVDFDSSNAVNVYSIPGPTSIPGADAQSEPGYEDGMANDLD